MQARQQILNLCDLVLLQVELSKLIETLKSTYTRDEVGLEGQNAQLLQSREAFDGSQLVLCTVELG